MKHNIVCCLFDTLTDTLLRRHNIKRQTYLLPCHTYLLPCRSDEGTAELKALHQRVAVGFHGENLNHPLALGSPLGLTE